VSCGRPTASLGGLTSSRTPLHTTPPRTTSPVITASGLFILIGAEPRAEWLPPELQRDERGFVVTGESIDAARWPLDRPPHPFETSIPGVFAAGDVRAGDVKRVAAAVGEGAVTVPMIHRYLEDVRRRAVR
jgi:thioredoxin reductase (NADPH)